MKKTFFLSMMAALLLSSCNESTTVTTQDAAPAVDSLQVTNPELYAAQNHKLELKADRGPMENPLDLNGFIQIALVVEDIDVAAKEWAELLGVPVPEVTMHQTPETTDPKLMYYGKNYKYGLKLASIKAPQGFIIELHQVVDDYPSTFNEFVKEHGYGVHHIGFQVGDRRDAIVNELEERGYPKRVEHFYNGGSWTIMDTEQALGVNLNIKPVP